ncbi:hypothetical protein LTR53_018874, partial [Teratosphaeriaceae sp. CCFEE 6253]
MILIHGDDKGLIIPPRVADIQVAIVPVGVTAKTTDADREKLYDEIKSIAATLEKADLRVECDFREGYSPGYKFNDWEMKGVPLRIEFGPKDSANGVVTTSRRDQEGKSTTPIADIAKEVPALLETIQADMFRKASEEYTAHRKIVREWKDFVPNLNQKNVVVVPHCATG